MKGKMKMIRQLCCIIFLFLASCTCPGIIGDPMTDQNFTTEHGLIVHPNGNWVSQSEIERATEALIINLDGFLPCEYPEEKVRYEIADGVTVEVKSDEFGCVISQNGELTRAICKGLYSGWTNTISYVNEDCIGDSAFIHEMLHMVNKHVAVKSDGDHESIRFFGDEDISLEHVINDYIKENYCPSCW